MRNAVSLLSEDKDQEKGDILFYIQATAYKAENITYSINGDFIILGQDPQSTLIPILYPIGYNPSNK